MVNGQGKIACCPLDMLENRQTPYSGYPLILDVPYRCSGHMVIGQDQTVGLYILCAVYSRY